MMLRWKKVIGRLVHWFNYSLAITDIAVLLALISFSLCIWDDVVVILNGSCNKGSLIQANYFIFKNPNLHLTVSVIEFTRICQVNDWIRIDYTHVQSEIILGFSTSDTIEWFIS